MFFKTILLLSIVLTVWGGCKFQTCTQCISNGCAWLESKGDAYCHTGRLPRSAYKVKIRSVELCPAEMPLPTTEPNAPMSTSKGSTKIIVTPTSTLPPSPTTYSNSTLTETRKGLEMIKPPAEEAPKYQLDENELQQEINLHQCRLYATIRRLRKLKKGVPMTNGQFKHMVKNCLKTIDSS